MRFQSTGLSLIGLSFLALSLVPASAEAHGPTRQKVTEDIAIAAAPAEVWKLVGNWDGWSAWHPAVDSSTATQGNAVGSVRTLKLKGGGQLIEEIEAYDQDTMTLKYRARDGGALPVTNYSATVLVKAAEGGGSTVTWRGAFYRGFPNNDPPPELNDDAAVAAVTGVYKTGLANLKTLLEKK
jgi:hypothetical protein